MAPVFLTIFVSEPTTGMKHVRLTLFLAIAMGLISTQSGGSAFTDSGDESAQKNNPLLAAWTGPYGGVPAFDKVRVADFEPALQAAMDEKLAEIERITSTQAAPSSTASGALR